MAHKRQSTNVPGNPELVLVNPEPVSTTTVKNGTDFAWNFLTILQEFVQNQVLQPNLPNRPHPARANEIMEQFRCMGPTRLKGTEGPIGTNEWIRELERIFGHMECTKVQKVSCAIFQLAEEASY